ncbi:hypothetical protein CsSME_00028696 [Camellia sinensis var. sinensis]
MLSLLLIKKLLPLHFGILPYLKNIMPYLLKALGPLSLFLLLRRLLAKTWLIDQHKCRSTKRSADQPKLLADGKKTRLTASSLGRWVQEMENKPPSSLRRKNTSAWSTTKHKTDKLRDPKARRVAETSENSKRTRAWMIIECSNDDIRVLRMVKNGVSTPTMSRSRTEAKYRSLAHATAELSWLQMLLHDLSLSPVSFRILWCDNSFTIALASNLVFHTRS